MSSRDQTRAPGNRVLHCLLGQHDLLVLRCRMCRLPNPQFCLLFDHNWIQKQATWTDLRSPWNSYIYNSYNSYSYIPLLIIILYSYSYSYNSYNSLSPVWLYLETGPLKRRLGLTEVIRARSSASRIGGLIRRKRDSELTHSLPCKDTVRRWLPASQEESPSRAPTPGT